MFTFEELAGSSVLISDRCPDARPEGWRNRRTADYYAVFSTEHMLTAAEHDPIHEWCVQQFGLDEDRWVSSYFGNFFFRDPHDAFAFKLRWC